MTKGRTASRRASSNDFKIIREVLLERIRGMILEGQWEPGKKLLEEELAAQFGVSRTPVREAMRKLESEGLVEYLPRRGVIVRGLSREDMAEIYSVRAVLEGLAARFAAMHISPRDLERLQTLQGQMAQAYAERDYKRAARVHTQFNAALYAASGNQRLIGMLMQFSDYIEHSKIVSLSLPHRAEEIRREHEAMIEAIAAHDPDAAEAAARLHVENAQRAFFAETRLPARFLGAPAS